jgi:hypothetical protein
MNTKKTIVLTLLSLLCLSASAVDVVIDLKDATLGVTNYANRNLKIYALGVPTISGPSVILGQPIPLKTDSSGIAWLSNAVYNLYQVQVLAPPKLEEFKFFLNETNSTPVMSATTNLAADATATFPAGSVAYAAAVTDLRYRGATPTAITNSAGYLGADGTLSFTNSNGYFQIRQGGLLYAYEIRAGEPGTDEPPGSGIIRGLFIGNAAGLTNFPGLTYDLVIVTNFSTGATVTGHFLRGLLTSVTAP